LEGSFDIDHEPEGYERVQCEVCNGIGMPRVGGGAIFAYDACAPLVYCRACGGKSYRPIKKEQAADPHDTTSG
jgi:hypothetical protein